MQWVHQVIVYGSVQALIVATLASADETAAPATALSNTARRDVLTERQWHEVDHSVDRALAWLVTQQRPDGSFTTLDTGQPAVTALCVLAFLSRGLLPDEG